MHNDNLSGCLKGKKNQYLNNCDTIRNHGKERRLLAMSALRRTLFHKNKKVDT